MKYVMITIFCFLTYLLTAQGQAEQDPLPVHIYTTTDVQSFEPSPMIQRTTEYGLEDGVELHLQKTVVDRVGISHHRYQQMYDGLPVVGAVFTFHESEQRLLAATGTVAEQLAVSSSVSLDQSEANSLATAYVIETLRKEQPAIARLATQPTAKPKGLVVIGSRYPAKSTEYVKAYHVQVDAHSRVLPVSKDIYVDAGTGRIVTSLNRVAHEHVPATGRGVFYPEASFLVDSVGPERFLMQDATRGGGIRVRNVNTGLTMESADNKWEYDTDGEASAVDVYYATGKYYDWMLERFGRNSIDGEGFPLEADVNIVGLVNAYWTGEQAFFGGGNCAEYKPLTNMEIVSHEYTHGLTQYTSGLIYRGQSGGLNEGMSDIFGKALEYYEDTERFNWYIGKTIARDPEETNPFRSMEDPNERFSPKYYKGEFWSDLGGVHRLSGVLNHWFYLLVEGGMGTNEAGYDYNVAAMGMDDAIDLVYHLQTNMLVPTSTYPEAFELSKLSCEMLYGANSPQMETMLEAWATVGLSDAILYANDLDFALELPQVQTGNNLTCASILEDFTIVLKYQGEQEIEAGSNVSGQVLIYEESSGDLLHTLPVADQSVDAPLTLGDSIVVQVGAPEEVETFSVRVEVEVEIVNSTGSNEVKLDQTFRIADGTVQGEQEIEAGSNVSGQVLIYEESSGDLLHTLPVADQSVDAPLTLGDSIVVQVGSPEEVETFSVRVEVEIVIVNSTGSNEVKLDQTFRIADGTVPNVSIVTNYDDDCDRSSGLSQAYLFVGKPTCRASDVLQLRLDLVGPDGTISVEEERTFTDDSGGLFVFGLQNSLGLATIDDLSPYAIEVFVESDQGDFVRVSRLDLASEIKDRVQSNTPLTFDNTLHNDQLTIEEAFSGFVSTVNNELYITGSSSSIESCLPLDLYFDALANSNRNRSTIGFCTEALTDNAALAFDVSYTNTDEELKEYQHLMQIYQGGTPLLDSPKSTGSTEGESLLLPLDASDGEDITIQVIALGDAVITIDNIEILTVVSTADEASKTDLSIRHDQLVTDLLTVSRQGNTTAATISLYTIDGQQVLKHDWSDSVDAEIEMSDIQSGMYVIHIVNTIGEQYTGKVIKID